MKVEFTGNIGSVRAVEDCIRATKKYTEGWRTMRKTHPVQGEEFPSRVFCKHYEVYPDIEVSWDMPVGVALDWLWGDVICIDVLLRYDYRANRASVEVKDGPVAIKELTKAIPGFSDALARVVVSGSERAGG